MDVLEVVFVSTFKRVYLLWLVRIFIINREENYWRNTTHVKRVCEKRNCETKSLC